ncbi:MAG TPA: hypothetical protein VFW69_18645 [Mycobacterium sp.]|nr:hypothetical protein [Mycobacterium sp.]
MDKLTEQVLCIFGVIPDEARRICCTPLPDAGRSGEPGCAGYGFVAVAVATFSNW